MEMFFVVTFKVHPEHEQVNGIIPLVCMVPITVQQSVPLQFAE